MSQPKQNPPSLFEEALSIINNGLKAEESGEYHLARRFYEEAVEKAPELYHSHYLMGRICVRTKEVERAVEHFQRVLRLKPDHSETHNDLGCLYIAESRLEDAKFHLMHAIEHMPDNLVARKNIVYLYISLAEYDKAMKEIDDILKRVPDDVDTLLQMARIYNLTNKREKAILAYKKAMSVASSNQEIRKEYEALLSKMEANTGEQA